jgi:hypothetical protein
VLNSRGLRGAFEFARLGDVWEPSWNGSASAATSQSRRAAAGRAPCDHRDTSQE